MRANRTLSAWPVRLIAELDAADQCAKELVIGLSQEQLNWKPLEDTWSVGQCLQHLQVANQVYLPAIANALDGRSPSPVQEITPGCLSRWFIHNYIEPSPQGRRARAPEKIAPAERIEPSILDLFLGSNEVARKLVRRASAYDVNGIRFKNPFVPLLRFTVGTGLEIVSKHQRRHLLQAERVRQASDFPER